MSNFPDTNPSAIATAGYKEIAPGVWLEAGAIDAWRGGREIMISPEVLALHHGYVPLSEIGEAFLAATGHRMQLTSTRRSNGWVVGIASFGAFVFLPAWVRDPGGCSWAEALG